MGVNGYDHAGRTSSDESAVLQIDLRRRRKSLRIGEAARRAKAATGDEDIRRQLDIVRRSDDEAQVI